MDAYHLPSPDAKHSLLFRDVEEARQRRKRNGGHISKGRNKESHNLARVCHKRSVIFGKLTSPSRAVSTLFSKLVPMTIFNNIMTIQERKQQSQHSGCYHWLAMAVVGAAAAAKKAAAAGHRSATDHPLHRSGALRALPFYFPRAGFVPLHHNRINKLTIDPLAR